MGMECAKNRVLILTTQNEKLDTAARFLSRRGWDVNISTDIRQGLNALVYDKPDFIFLSIHLAGTQLPVMQKLVRSQRDSTLILFSELATAESAERLMNTEAEHIVYPSAGGPAFDRCLKRIMLEKKGKAAKGRGGAYWPYGSTVRTRQTVNMSILNECLRIALNKICGYTLKNSYQKRSLSQVSRLACIEIRSQSFRGYLVAARANNQTLSKEFMMQIRKSIADAMLSSGEILNESEIYAAEVREVDFKFWTAEQAHCFQTDHYHGEEVGLAFFDYQDLNFENLSERKHHMVGIQLSEEILKNKATFDLYLYLPRNERFIRYTRRGERIAVKQYAKLKSRSITHLYFRQHDLLQWKTQQITKFFKDKVEQFQALQQRQVSA